MRENNEGRPRRLLNRPVALFLVFPSVEEEKPEQEEQEGGEEASNEEEEAGEEAPEGGSSPHLMRDAHP